MRFSLPMIATLQLCLAFSMACTKPPHAATNATPSSRDSSANPPPPADGEYFGKGTITKIDLGIGSIELDHEAVPGLMPAMQMEFYVSDKALLNDMALGDKVDFTILYKAGTETITKIGKTK